MPPPGRGWVGGSPGRLHDIPIWVTRCRVLLSERLMVSCEASGDGRNRHDEAGGADGACRLWPSGWAVSVVSPLLRHRSGLTVRHSQAGHLPPPSPGAGWSMPRGAGGGKQPAGWNRQVVRPNKGYGFIKPESGNDMVMHVSAIQEGGWLEKARPWSSTSSRAARAPGRQRAPARHPSSHSPTCSTGSRWATCVPPTRPVSAA
jgi:hypothetical protein